jgi:hypothetical protein
MEKLIVMIFFPWRNKISEMEGIYADVNNASVNSICKHEPVIWVPVSTT